MTQLNRFHVNLIHAFFGGAIATAGWSVVTSFIRFGEVPLGKMVIAAAFVGIIYGLIYAVVHTVGKFQPTLMSAITVALGTLALGVVFSMSVGLFVGWSLTAVASLFVFSGLIGGFTHLFTNKF